MLTQLKLEFLKLIRSRSFFLSSIALTAFVALMLWGFYSYAERKAGEQVTSQFKYTYESKSLLQRPDLRALLGDVFLQLIAPNIWGDDRGRANRRRTTGRHAPHDLRAAALSGFAAALEIPGRSFLYVLVSRFLYRIEFVGRAVLRGLGRSATVSGRAQSRG